MVSFKNMFRKSSSFLAMISHSAVQSSTWTLFTMLFCSWTPQILDTTKLIFRIEKPHLAIIASNDHSIVKKIHHQTKIYTMFHFRKRKGEREIDLPDLKLI